MRIKENLTGEYRFSQVSKGILFKKTYLTLQFEYRRMGFLIEYTGGTCMEHDVDYLTWKDATLESLQEFQKEFKGVL